MDYLSKINCTNRLLEEYLKHNKLIVAFDFDNTVFDTHNLGLEHKRVIEILQKCSEYKFDMILFTVEENAEKLQFKIECCKQLGINVDYVNESPLYPTAIKPYYNILLDDRAGLESAVEQMELLFYMISLIKNNIPS